MSEATEWVSREVSIPGVTIHLGRDPDTGEVLRIDPAVTAREPAKYDISGRSHPQYAEACAVVRKHRRGSISLVQRDLRIGYITAAMLLEAMVGDVIAEMPPTTKLLKTCTEPSRISGGENAPGDGGSAQ